MDIVSSAVKRVSLLTILIILLLGLLGWFGGSILIKYFPFSHKIENVVSTTALTLVEETTTISVSERILSTPPTETTSLIQTKTSETGSLTMSTTQAFKPLGPKSIIMLIGDLDVRGPNPSLESKLRKRIDTASTAGVDTVIIVFRTSSIEKTLDHLDQLLNYAATKNLGVIPRIVVDSQNFTERIKSDPRLPDSNLPDFTNASQLTSGLNLLRRVILHLESFPNVVGYQIEWGHFGESWINAAFWNSTSSNKSFNNFLSKVAPTLLMSEFAWWLNRRELEGDIIFYSENLPATDPRRDPAKVAIFYWYQEWRNQMTLNITWSFRCLAKELTLKPIVGFSYVGVLDISYVYSADRCLDAAFSPFTPHPTFRPTRFYIRDSYFQGLQFVELDFDSPYIQMEYAEEVIADAYRKGIIPVIFYPEWSTKLKDSDIPKLTQYMKKYTQQYGVSKTSSVLVVIGHHDVGYFGYSGSPPIAVANWHSVEPPGFLRFLEDRKIAYDIADIRVYTPELGKKYKAVVVFAPRDTVDGELMSKLSRTNSTVFVMFPSFIVGTPSRNRPYDVSSAILGMWNEVDIKGRKIELQVTGSPPVYQVNFRGALSMLGSMIDYVANHLFSYFRGAFDEVLAEVKIGDEHFTSIGRIRNIYFIGLDIHVPETKNRSIIFDALRTLLAEVGVQMSQ